MASNTNNSTGIGVRGGKVQLGGLAMQPVPFVLQTANPVLRPVNPIIPTIATPAIAAAIIENITPLLVVPASSIINRNLAGAVRALLPAGLTTVQSRPAALNPAILLQIPDLVPFRRPNEEAISLANLQVSNGLFDTSNIHGIHPLRPEIIGLMDFEPVYSKDSLHLNDVGTLMDVQYQSRQLREHTFMELVSGIKQTDTSHQLAEIQNQFSLGVNRVNSAADFYQNTIIMLNSIKNGFDVKTVPNNSFNLLNFRTLRDFYETFMLFPKPLFDKFANTKILMQFLFDMRSMAEGYSMNLLNGTDPDRQAGGSALDSPVSIDKSYNTRAGFTFTYDTIRSYNQAINATKEQFFNRFNSSLPQSPDDRTKILLSLLSKELRVSRGLGRTAIQTTLRQKFAATTTDGSPFDNILGGVGRTIFDPISGPGSLASLMMVNDSPEMAVLPFEIKFIDANSLNKVYIPGSTFFVDSILNLSEGAVKKNHFNLAPLRTYVNKYIDTVDAAADVIVGSFDYSHTPSELSPLALYKQILQKILESLSQLTPDVQVRMNEAATIAAFKLATTDPTLKNMLFQYVVITFLARIRDASVFVTALTEELENDIHNLSFVPLTSEDTAIDLKDAQNLQPYLIRLANTIQNKIMELVNQRTLQTLGRSSARTGRGVSEASDGRTRIGYDMEPDTLSHSFLVRGFGDFMVGLETTLGNEVNNILDSSKRTRFNSVSVSTLTLMAFEIFSSLVSRFTNSEFAASDSGDNFLELLVDRDFNARAVSSIQNVILDPELPLPVIEAVPSLNSTLVKKKANVFGSRFNLPQAAQAAHQLSLQVPGASMAGNTSTDVHNGVTKNRAILAGIHSTAGTQFMQTADFVLRQVTSRTNPQALLDYQSIDSGLNSIAFKIFEDDFAIACALHILLVIKKRLRASLDLATNYFTDQTLSSFLSLNATNISDISKNLTQAQVRLLLRQKNDYIKSIKANTSEIQFIPSSPTENETRQTILSLLDDPGYRETTDAATHYRLLTVGIPAGFSKNLTDRINTASITLSSFQKDKAYEVVYINVYRRSLEYPQVIFKPKKYIFDISLFSNGYSDLEINGNERFSSVIQRISLLDYQVFNQPNVVTLESIITDERYSFIPNAMLKREMVTNHIVSDLFSSYIQELTTMKITEDTFVDKNSSTYKAFSSRAEKDLSPKFASLVKKYLFLKRTQDMIANPALTPLPDISIQEMILSPQVDQPTKDVLKLLQFGNIAFKPEQTLAKILSPKLFDRVFTIPLNVDEFEIDYTASIATESGREFFEKNFVQELLDPNAPKDIYRFKPRTHKDAIFEDFFVTVEVVE